MLDTHDSRLLEHVRPPAWTNPPPASKYDLVVIGGGTAGLVCAAGAAGLGARVALVERSRLGGDCLNTGCVPSKALLRSARVVGEAHAGAVVGVNTVATPEFDTVMARLRARRADIAPNDSAARLRSLGVDVFFGHAAFAGPREIAVRDEHASGEPARLTFRKAVIATGSRPSVPPIPGLADVQYLTSETLFDLTTQPRRMIVLGGGPIGCEMAQAFARLGTEVVLVEAAAQLLPQDDPDAAAIVADRLRRDGVKVMTGARATAVSGGPGRITLALGSQPLTADALLVAAGRTPVTDGLALDVAGVEHGDGGVKVNDRLRTTNPRVYAAGDVCSRYKFTHAADALARIVIQNALFFGRRNASALVIPWSTFTVPEVARAGITSAQAAARGASTVEVPLREVDRAVIDEETDGFVRVHHDRGRLLGATIVAPHAGELIATIAFAMQHGHTLADLAQTVFVYPTLSLALRQAGDAYRRGALTPAVRRALETYFRVLR